MKLKLNKMKSNPKIWAKGGVFTMVHMLMPHDPYREENCSITNRYTAPSKEGYRSSVYCALSRIHKLSDIIIKNFPNASIVVQADHGVYPDNFTAKNSNFIQLPKLFIDYRMGAFNAVRGCNSKQAAKLNQSNIVKYIVECFVNGAPTNINENKSFYYWSHSDNDYGKFFSVDQE